MATSTRRRLRPRRRMRDVFGDAVYVRRTAPSGSRWLPPDPGLLDFLSGVSNAIAGPTTVVCAEATAGPEALDLLAEAGLPVEADLCTYRDVPEYLALLGRLVASGRRLALQSQHAASEVPPEACLVDPEVVRTLNDKGRLGELVPPSLVPERRVFPPEELPAPATLLRSGRPVVLKAANRLPSGAGVSVRICRTPAQVERAAADMAGEPGVVVEEFLDVVRSACVHAIVLPDGSVEALGVAEQVCDDDGGYHGNWLDAESDAVVPGDVLAAVRGVFERASSMGYRGFAGIDVASLPDGSARVLDLNFRMNGSTPAALLRESIEGERGPVAIRSLTFTAREVPDLLAAARGAVARGTLVPLCLYDPRRGAAGGAPRLGALLVGESREAVRAEERRLAAEGLG